MAIRYVRISGNDNNLGDTPEAAWRTLQKAVRGTTGTFTSGSLTTLTVSSLTASQWIGAVVTILTGTGAGSTGIVTANTSTLLTVASWSGTAPSGTGTYQITHLSAGDTLYIGAGYYRERNVLFTTIDPASTITIQGDVTGAYTGDGGEVVFAPTVNSSVAAAQGSNILSGNGRSNFDIKYLSFYNTSASQLYWCIGGIGAGWNISNCYFYGLITQNNANGINFTHAYNTSGGSVRNCIFNNLYNAITFEHNVGATGSEYNLNVWIERCTFMNISSVCVVLGNASKTGTGKGNGVHVRNCSAFNASTFIYGLFSNAVGTVYPSTVADCYSPHSAFSATQFSGGLGYGYLIDLGGNWFANGVSSSGNRLITSLKSSVGASGIMYLDNYHSYGHEWLLGLPANRLTAPRPFSGPRGITQAVNNTLSMTGGSLFDGTSCLIDSGTTTAATTTTLTCATKVWPIGDLVGASVYITGGTGAGQIRTIIGNSGNQLTISAATSGGGGLWAVTPDTTSTFLIYRGPIAETGKATAATSSTLTDSNAAFGTNRFLGCTLEITAGTGVGQKRIVQGNTSTVFTINGGTTFTVTFSGTTTGGTYVFCFRHVYSAAIAYNASAATVQAALEAMSTIGAGNVTVSGGPIPTTMTITFINALATNTTDELSIGTATLTGSSPSGTVVGAWATLPDSTSQYALYFGTSGMLAPQAYSGALGAHNAGVADSTVFDSGPSSLRLDATGSHEFELMVPATATTISIAARYDSYYGGTTQKPRLILLAQPDLGVTQQTATMMQAVDTWETLSLTFTPTKAGVITIRLVATSDTIFGKSYYDTLQVT